MQNGQMLRAFATTRPNSLKMHASAGEEQRVQTWDTYDDCTNQFAPENLQSMSFVGMNPIIFDLTPPSGPWIYPSESDGCVAKIARACNVLLLYKAKNDSACDNFTDTPS